MDLSNILHIANCSVDRRFADKAACLGDLARRAATTLALDPAPILDALKHREALGPTGLGNGIALPHARLASIQTPFVMITRLREPIAFDAVDDRPVDIVCLALLPAAKSSDPLNALACIARRLRDKDDLAAIRKAKDAQALYEVMTRANAKPA